MRLTSFIVLTLILALLLAAPALANWPTGAQGDQYAAVNAAMQSAAAQAGISSDTFIAIYNAAVAGNTSEFSEAQKQAACEVLGSLSAYKSLLDDYDTVYSTLGCGTLLATSGPSRSALPSTGIAIALLAGSGVLGIGAASHMLRKSRKQKS